MTTTLSVTNSKEICEYLNQQLAAGIQASMMVHYGHWNVKGLGFMETHLMFDGVYELLSDIGDKLAERITALGGVAEGLPNQVFSSLSPKAYSAGPNDGCKEHIQAVAEAVAFIANGLREGIDKTLDLGDQVTGNLLAEIVYDLDKKLYFLNASLK